MKSFVGDIDRQIVDRFIFVMHGKASSPSNLKNLNHLRKLCLKMNEKNRSISYLIEQTKF
jgi:hypothetical protein